MESGKLLRTSLLAAIWMLAASSPALAQSAISGIVRDASGAVLPGVTVTASSPALIERSRTAVCDGAGAYRIVDLRPGTYLVTFELSGFQTVRREGIPLEANFTATVNAEMKVGAVEETITVTGASPLVDVQTTAKREVLTRDLLDTLPTGRSFQGIGATLPALSMGRFDVAGSNAMQQGVLVVYGGTGTDLAMEIDGLNVMGTLDRGWYPLVYHNDGEFQEMVYQVAGGPAESQTGGVRINMIPKAGGNQFRGDAALLYSSTRFQSSNLTDDLVRRGYVSPGRLQRLWDVDPTFGGPIKKDRIWFFVSYRDWAYNNYVGNIFYRDGRPGVDDNHVQAFSNRLTLLPTPRDRIHLSWNRYPRIRYHSGIETGLNTPYGTGILDIVQTHISQLKWTSTLSNRLLLEAAGIVFPYYYNSKYQPEVRRATCFTASVTCEPGTDYGDISRFNISNGITDIASQNPAWNRLWKDGVMAALSYITGTHTLKAGLTFQSGYNRNGSLGKNADLVQRYRGTGNLFVPGVWLPDSVSVANTPYIQQSNLDADIGIYVQDSWRINRLTLNPGLRFEYLRGSTKAVDLPAGRFVPARHFDAIPDLPNWKDITPRVGIAYDLFGDGRTALKGSVGKYTQQEATGFSNTYNPSVSSTDIRTWRDVNGDDIARENEIGPPTNSTFGIRRNRKPDPDIERPYQVLYNVGVQREMRSGLSVSANYYRRDYYRIIWTENLAIPVSGWTAEYTPIAIPDPRGNGQTVTIYNVNPAFASQVNELDRNSTSNSRTYNGIDFTVNARFRNGATLVGGTSTGNLHAVICDVPDPNQLRGCDARQPFRTQAKLTGTFPLPYALRFSAVFQSMPGVLETRTASNDGDVTINYIVNRTIVPNLTLAQVTTRLNEPGADFLDRDTQLDISLTRDFRAGRVVFKPQLDLFNVFNVSPVTNEVATWGPQVGKPLTILPGRLLRFGFRLNY
ncbi:MAG: hypothetical protein AUF76_17230 [Acidobacteria bacterium 13_1_20CM_2_65_9]|nr:MAG: hypothetical protein AUF76_17230 [Acidobacteria bacterium 13_1_20CM_2_65_9]